MIFIDACLKKETEYTPIWMMRQAGRYLPEYMATRAEAGDFISLCKNPKLACEVTLQPIDILGVDAAILFSDILVVPMEMGLDLSFVKNKGPVFANPILKESDLDRLEGDSQDRLTYVYDAISMIREQLSKDKALIGFAGAPWTLVTYMVEGEGSKTYNRVKREVYENPAFMHKLLQLVTDEVIKYVERQIEAGVDAIQIFDSWANALESDVYLEFGWSYIKQICDKIKAKYPHIPIIAFPKGVSNLEKYDGNFDVFGVHWSTPLDEARDALSDRYTLQGNLEPARIYSKERIKEGVESILETMKGKNHIFNLGHGMIPDLKPENAKYLVELVQKMSKRG